MNNHLNLTHVSRELRFMLELVTENKKQDNMKAPDLDWPLFLKLALHHRLFPVLSPQFNQLIFPSHVSRTLTGHYQRNTFHMLHLCAEMEKVSKLLHETDIPALFLKGPILAQALYGDLSLRTSSDLDFLVPLEQLHQTEELLGNLGYQKNDYIETILNDWHWRHHHVTYFHPDKKIKLEIHWRLHPGPGKEPDFGQLWSRKQKSAWTESPVFFPGKEDLFLFLVCHGARHGWSRLRWLLDIQQLMKQDLDWPFICALFNKYSNPAVAGQALLLVSELLKADIPPSMQSLADRSSSQRLAQEAIFYLENMVNLHTDPVPEHVSRYHARHLFSLMSFGQKCLFTASFLYPYPEDARTLPLPLPLHFLYFPLRPLLWTWRKTRKPALS